MFTHLFSFYPLMMLLFACQTEVKTPPKVAAIADTNQAMQAVQAEKQPAHLLSLATEFNDLNTQIRDGLIAKAAAKKEIARLIPLLKKEYQAAGGKNYGKTSWVFPLQGYTKSAIGGKNGSGYVATGYDYFQGNKHGGHPAHDIFIRDTDQDALDDKTNSAVNVLSVSGGIVVALEKTWDTDSPLRGGCYIWVYD
ncbi:MAG: hypothetical protein ACKVTZ_12055, partial [Bacteroidia bacterium]